MFSCCVIVILYVLLFVFFVHNFLMSYVDLVFSLRLSLIIKKSFIWCGEAIATSGSDKEFCLEVQYAKATLKCNGLTR